MINWFRLRDLGHRLKRVWQQRRLLRERDQWLRDQGIAPPPAYPVETLDHAKIVADWVAHEAPRVNRTVTTATLNSIAWLVKSHNEALSLLESAWVVVAKENGADGESGDVDVDDLEEKIDRFLREA